MLCVFHKAYKTYSVPLVVNTNQKLRPGSCPHEQKLRKCH